MGFWTSLAGSLFYFYDVLRY